jgi:hypothetical protein
MKIIFALIISALTSSAFAALPPYWDKVMQMQAVMNSREVENRIEEEIRVIEDLGNYTFRVSSRSCVTRVQLEAHSPRNVIGPITYTVKSVDVATCLP